MTVHHQAKCPNCSRELTEDEIYCYFCEMDVPKLKKELDKSPKKSSHGKNN